MNSPAVTLDLADDSVLLNESVLEALDRPRQIQIMINEKERILLLRACTVGDSQAVVVPDMRMNAYEISGRVLLRKIRKLLGWEDSCPRVCFGEYLPVLRAVRFSLDKAVKIEGEG